MDRERVLELDPCTIEGACPFDDVLITAEQAPDGKPTGCVTIEGLRQGGSREVRDLLIRLWEQTKTYMQSNHGKTCAEPISVEKLEHAWV